MNRMLPAAVLCLLCYSAWANQTYVPPPPPKLPAMLNEDQVKRGEKLFNENVLPVGRIEIHNYLGSQPCGGCHDQPNPLDSESLARGFKKLRAKVNEEIATKLGGEPLPLQGPAMDSLVQYMVQRYKLYDHKLSQ